MSGDEYDDMGTADLLREVCRKLDRIEKQGAPKAVEVRVERRQEHTADDWARVFGAVTDFDGTVYPRRPGALCGY